MVWCFENFDDINYYLRQKIQITTTNLFMSIRFDVNVLKILLLQLHMQLAAHFQIWKKLINFGDSSGVDKVYGYSQSSELKWEGCREWFLKNCTRARAKMGYITQESQNLCLDFTTLRISINLGGQTIKSKRSRDFYISVYSIVYKIVFKQQVPKRKRHL